MPSGGSAHSDNRVLRAQFRAVRFVLQPLLEPTTTEEVAHRVIRSHTTLLRALTAGEADKAGEVMKRRIAEVRAKVFSDPAPVARSGARKSAVR